MYTYIYIYIYIHIYIYIQMAPGPPAGRGVEAWELLSFRTMLYKIWIRRYTPIL